MIVSIDPLPLLGIWLGIFQISQELIHLHSTLVLGAHAVVSFRIFYNYLAMIAASFECSKRATTCSTFTNVPEMVILFLLAKNEKGSFQRLRQNF